MQFIPPLSAILLLIGTTFSLQAIPMFEEGEDPARQKSTPGAAQEAQGRRISESSSAGEASMDQGHFYRQDGSQELQSSSMERTSISSGTAGAATAPTVLTPTEEQHLQASEPAADGGSFQGHSVAAVEPKPISRQSQPYRPFSNDFTASALRYSTIKQVLTPQASPTSTQRSQPAAGAATGSTVLPSTEEHPQASAPATTTGGSLEGRAVAAVASRTTYRHVPQGWQVQDATTGTWKATDSFADNSKAANSSTPPDIHMAAVGFFGNNYNRSETIDKRKATFQAELCQKQIKDSSPESEHRIFGLQHLIAVLEKASSYQKAMVRHLQESGSAGSISLQISLQKSYFSKINESPNKIEKIAHQLEVNIKDLLTHQALLDIVEAHIAPHITLGEHPPQDLLDTKQKLIDAISHQKASIEAKAAYATLLPPPYEVIDEATQTAIDQLALTCRQESLLARKITTYSSALNAAFSSHYEAEARQQAAKEAQEHQPREQVITWFTQSANLYQQAAALYATGDRDRGRSLSLAGSSFLRAAVEAQQPQPRKQVIDLFTQSADLFQQAIAAYATDRMGVDLLSITGRCFFLAAEEAQQPQPREQVIAWFTQSADLFQQAADDVYATDQMGGELLSNTGSCFFCVAEEAQQPQPRKQVIDFFTQSANLYQQAAAACATGDRDRGWSLANAGEVFFSAATEAHQPQPQEQVIALFTQSADLYQQSADAFAAVYMHRGKALFNAGRSFFYAAKEASRLNPNQDIIDGHLREAQENI